jgi:DNA recombination protein RmuC
MDNIGILLVALLVGVALGAAAAWFLLRRTADATAGADAERLRAAEQAARADAERARADIAAAELRVKDAEVRMAEARVESERVHGTVAEARAEVANAQAEAAEQAARVAGLRAQLEATVVERDTARERAAEITADRDALVKEFKLLSGQALDEQGRKADATAEARLKATDQLMAPIKESLARFNDRLTEVEKARVAMSTELAQQVRAVQFTGEQLRRETSALSTALRKPQVRGAWGELQLKRVAELAGMLEYCDFTQQSTSTTSEDRVIRPDLKVTLAEGKFVYVDAKVPLAAFLDAQETEDERDREHHLALFAKNVKGHVDALGGKNYWKADRSSSSCSCPTRRSASRRCASSPTCTSTRTAATSWWRRRRRSSRCCARSPTGGSRPSWPSPPPRCPRWAASCTSASAPWVATSIASAARSGRRSRRTTPRSARWRPA